MTFSGGECTLQTDFIVEVIEKVKRKSSLTAFIDTNGLIKEEDLKKLIPLVDGFMLDIKAVEDDVHKMLTGVSNEVVIKNLNILSKTELLYEVRYVLIEGYNDSIEQVKKLANLLYSLNDYTRLVLIPFRPLGVKTHLKDMLPFSREKYGIIYDEVYTILKDRLIKRIDVYEDKRVYICSNLGCTFGSAGIFVKEGYSSNFSPVDLLMLQYIIAGIILFLICLVRYKNSIKLNKTLFKKLLLQGAVFNTLMTVFFYTSFKYLTAAEATLLLYTYPSMVAIYTSLFKKQRIGYKKVVSIILAFIGSILVLNLFNIELNKGVYQGIVYGVLSAVFYSAMNIYAEEFVEDVEELVITFYTTMFSLFVLFIFNYRFIFKLPYVDLVSIKNALNLALFCEIIPLTLLYAAIKHIGPVSTSIISTLEIPSSAILGFLFLKETLSLIQVFGIVVVVLSIIYLKKS
ncbi:EamA family transporter [Caloramator sp. mosi_1]|uniref:EamA family transporter n=1 Tax=Caloramator sp. mosi_1 TaxID=3023090 RepID=UPI00236037F6|nr:EamA family transporter [Caloramator sp. mosi_1]WDC85527.1 EamA family transporter [Caloramator sp. mosi_1]